MLDARNKNIPSSRSCLSVRFVLSVRGKKFQKKNENSNRPRFGVCPYRLVLYHIVPSTEEVQKVCRPLKSDVMNTRFEKRFDVFHEVGLVRPKSMTDEGSINVIMLAYASIVNHFRLLWTIDDSNYHRCSGPARTGEASRSDKMLAEICQWRRKDSDWEATQHVDMKETSSSCFTGTWFHFKFVQIRSISGLNKNTSVHKT